MCGSPVIRGSNNKGDHLKDKKMVENQELYIKYRGSIIRRQKKVRPKTNKKNSSRRSRMKIMTPQVKRVGDERIDKNKD